MNRILIILFTIQLFACGQKTTVEVNDNIIKNIEDSIASKNYTSSNGIIESVQETEKPTDNYIISDGPSRAKFDLSKPTVIVVQLDSLEIEKVKEIDSEDNFYTAADDLMWYNSMMLEKMDSLKIPVIYTYKDTTEIITDENTITIIKDTTFSLYTYYYFDGKKLKRADLFELIEK